jgi:hypothetical protein
LRTRSSARSKPGSSLLSLIFFYSFVFFPTTSLISLIFDRRSSTRAPPSHLRPRAEVEQERRPFARPAVLPCWPSPRPQRRQVEADRDESGPDQIG